MPFNNYRHLWQHHENSALAMRNFKSFLGRLKHGVILLVLIILAFNTSFPLRTLAFELANLDDATTIELKVAKGYSNKFCNGIAMGLTKQSALKIAIAENRKPSFNPSLWTALISNDKQLENIDKDKVPALAVTLVARDCGDPIGLNNGTELDEFAENLTSVFADSAAN
ncbi:MAG: hypothetical protein AB8A66_01415 [Prochlorococcus sp.]